MKRVLSCIVATLVSGVFAVGQGNPQRPAVPPSPIVQPDGQVTFNLLAPNAASVSLDGDYPLAANFHGGRKITQLTKDDKGVWSVTVGPLKPDIYNYAFSVDGTHFLDPQNVHVSPSSAAGRITNWLVVPGPGSDNYLIHDVPHGRLSEVWYPSPTLHLTRRLFVYTPPGYDSGAERYPVFYLYHGGGEDETTWTILGRAPEILDNLIAQGKMVPMIVVMPNWNVRASVAPADANPAPPGNPGPGGPGAQPDGRPADAFPQSVVHDLIPFVDKSYRTIADRDHRAVAGTSAGGTQAILTGLQHLDQFSWVGLLSPALARVPNSEIKIPLPADADSRRGPDLGVSIDPEKFAANFPDMGPDWNKRIHLLYFSVGGSEGLLEEEKAGAKVFDDHGVKYHWVTRPDYGHEWAFWRQDLEDFGSLLFKSSN
jgi:enterochelin esterase-like enzyme